MEVTDTGTHPPTHLVLWQQTIKSSNRAERWAATSWTHNWCWKLSHINVFFKGFQQNDCMSSKSAQSNDTFESAAERESVLRLWVLLPCHHLSLKPPPPSDLISYFLRSSIIQLLSVTIEPHSNHSNQTLGVSVWNERWFIYLTLHNTTSLLYFD